MEPRPTQRIDGKLFPVGGTNGARVEEHMKKSLRFEIFKRDKFTCQYCGRTPPEVMLEIDHIMPQSQGGDDDPQNLITSCFDCNRGKAGRPLGFTKVREDLEEEISTIAEREEQLKRYKEMKSAIRRREDRDINRIEDRLSELLSEDVVLSSHGRESFRWFLQTFAVERIIEAVELAFLRLSTNNPERIIKYTYGILHNWRRDGT